jgi:Kef-type K+ transport system membrane component KefB
MAGLPLPLMIAIWLVGAMWIVGVTAYYRLGGLAGWADSEAVLPAYLIGMILAGSVGKDHILIRRLRTLCFGFLTPFYFIRAGSFVLVPALLAAPTAFAVMLVVKLVTKIAGVYPVARAFGSPYREGMYTTLLMSTGLTFGTITSLFGLSHGIISQAQYSGLVAAVIGSAVVPTLIANAFCLPRHLLPGGEIEAERKPAVSGDTAPHKIPGG